MASFIGCLSGRADSTAFGTGWSAAPRGWQRAVGPPVQRWTCLGITVGGLGAAGSLRRQDCGRLVRRPQSPGPGVPLRECTTGSRKTRDRTFPVDAGWRRELRAACHNPPPPGRRRSGVGGPQAHRAATRQRPSGDQDGGHPARVIPRAAGRVTRQQRRHGRGRATPRRLGGTGRVRRVGDLVELVVQQMAVQVEGHRRRLVAEHRLHHLDVRAAGDGQRGGGVP